METVMIIAPHPDDAELAMAGTILALVAAKYRVVMIDLTDGEPTPHGSPEIRRKETADASAILGVTERKMLGIKNREIFDTVENRNKVAAVIREYKPSVLFVPYWEDLHPDHVQASALCDAARFYSKFVKSDLPHAPHTPRRTFYFFSTHLRIKVQPTFVYDISNYIDGKMAAITAYQSQFAHNKANLSRLDEIRMEAAYWGFQSGCAFAEPFLCREQIKIGDPMGLLHA